MTKITHFRIASFILTISICLNIPGFLTACANSPENEGPYDPASVEFSRDAGAYAEKSFKLELTAPDGYQIYYTTNGEIPDTTSEKYRKPIQISGNGNNWLDSETASTLYLEEYYYYQIDATPDIPDAWIIRAVAYAPDGTAGPVVTKTYFSGLSLEEEYGDVAVISLVTDPEGLLGYEKGIMVKGKIYDEWIGSDESKELLEEALYYYYPANYHQRGKDWEREASFELFDGSDELTLALNCGIRMNGNMSRAAPHKSFRLYFRGDGKSDELIYPVFNDLTSEQTGEEITDYKCLILRNGGNCSQTLMYKDAWQQSLLKDMNFSTQAGRLAILYLNGEYWGAYVLCERLDEEYISSHYGVENVAIIKEDEVQSGGDEGQRLYDELMKFADMDLSEEENWNEFCEIMDISSMIDYYAVHVYIGNADFRTDKNIQFWRSIDIDPDNPYADGKWRYMLFDTEYSSSLYDEETTSPEYDTLTDVREANPLFDAAMENAEFSDQFYNALEQIGTGPMDAEKAEESLLEWANLWNLYLAKQQLRFGGSLEQDEIEIRNITDFYRERLDYINDKAE